MAGKKEARAYQKISDGVYRVSGTVRRSAVTGRYLTEDSRRLGLPASRGHKPAWVGERA